MFGAAGPLRRSKTKRLLLLSESRLVALRQTMAAGSGGRALSNTSVTRWRNCLVVPALANGRTTMKHFVLSIALLALVAVAVSTTAQAYYHHRHHHYWHHGGGGSYWNYYRTSWPGRGNDEASTR